MKLKKMILVCTAFGMLLCGCSQTAGETERMFQSDTVVNIPLNPDPTETEPAEQEETVPETTVPETEAALEETKSSSQTTTTKTTTTKTTTSGKTTSSKTSSGKTETKATEPAATETPATEAPATEPPAADPPETQPPETESSEAAVYHISGYTAGVLEYAVVDQINARRAEEGLEPLAMSGTLCGIASVRAYEVCLSWSHTRPNGSGWQSVLSDYGYGYSTAAEDLVHTAGFDGAAIVSKWMDSDGSRADILNPDFTTIGVGIYSADGTVFLAAIFVG